MNRKDIITKIIEEQNKVIESLTLSVERYKTASDLDEESTHDPEDFSQQTQAKDMQLRYEKTRREALQQLNFLQSEIEEEHDQIEAGTLVETDDGYLFVGISVPAFKVGNKEVITFSEEAPVFGNIKGKKVGDTVKIGENSMKIISFK